MASKWTRPICREITTNLIGLSIDRCVSINNRQGLLSNFATLRYVLQNMVAHVVSNFQLSTISIKGVIEF